jgi:hypothetical protein
MIERAGLWSRGARSPPRPARRAADRPPAGDGLGVLVAAVNLHVLFRAGLWLSGALPGVDPGEWSTWLQPGNTRYVLAVLAGAVLALEPYLLAAATVYVHKVGSRSSGEDLRLWLDRLRRSVAA